jgi:hypothetical protein
VPRPALVDYEGRRGVWTPSGDRKAQFVAVELGMEGPERVEIVKGLSEGDEIVVVGAASLRADDTLMIPSEDGASGGPGMSDGTNGPQRGAPGGRPQGGVSQGRRPAQERGQAPRQ